MMNIVDRLLKDTGMSQNALAKRMGVTPPTIHRMRVKDHTPTLDIAMKFAYVYLEHNENAELRWILEELMSSAGERGSGF
jgi:plasmid maintenance system antidote protein VapI